MSVMMRTGATNEIQRIKFEERLQVTAEWMDFMDG